MDNSDKPEEKKPTPNQQAIEDLSWDIVFFRTIKNFFIREGEFVKNGWVAVLVIVGIFVWLTHSITKSNLEDSISNLNGQLTDAKQDRDKFQTDFFNAQYALAPWMELANSQFSNAPISKRLTLLFDQVEKNTEILTNALNGLHPDPIVFGLEINGVSITNVEVPIGAIVTNTIFAINKTNDITVDVINLSKKSAVNPSLDFFSDINPTNITTDGWQPEPTDAGINHWHLHDNDNLPEFGKLESKLKIRPDFSGQTLTGKFLVFSDNSTPYHFYLFFVFK